MVSGFCLTLKHRYFILIHRDTSKPKNDWLFLPFGEKCFIFQKYFQLSLPNNLSAHAIKMLITWGLLLTNLKVFIYHIYPGVHTKIKYLHHFFFVGHLFLISWNYFLILIVEKCEYGYSKDLYITLAPVFD